MLGKCVECVNYNECNCDKNRLPIIGELGEDNTIFSQNDFIKAVKNERFCLDYKKEIK